MALDPNIILQAKSPDVLGDIQSAAQIQGQQIDNQTKQLALQRQQLAMKLASSFAETNEDGSPKIDPTTGAQSFNKQGYASSLLSHGLAPEAQTFITNDLINQSKNISNNQQKIVLQQQFNGYASQWLKNIHDEQMPSAIDHVNKIANAIGLTPIQTPPATDKNGKPLSSAQQSQWYRQNVIEPSAASTYTPQAASQQDNANLAAYNDPASADPNSQISINARQQLSGLGIYIPETMSRAQIYNTPGLREALATSNTSNVQTSAGRAGAVGAATQYNDDLNSLDQGRQLYSKFISSNPNLSAPGVSLVNITDPSLQAARGIADSMAKKYNMEIHWQRGSGVVGQELETLRAKIAQAQAVAGQQATQPTISGGLPPAVQPGSTTTALPVVPTGGGLAALPAGQKDTSPKGALGSYTNPYPVTTKAQALALPAGVHFKTPEGRIKVR